jgi:hypothetical protein
MTTSRPPSGLAWRTGLPSPIAILDLRDAGYGRDGRERTSLTLKDRLVISVRAANENPADCRIESASYPRDAWLRWINTSGGQTEGARHRGCADSFA